MNAQPNELFPSSAWRFLLPDPSPEVGLRFGPDSPRLPAGVNEGDHATGPADLVTCATSAHEILSAMFKATKPGGACYVELQPPRWSNPKDLRARLTEAGFLDVRLYSLTQAAHRERVSWWIPVGRHKAREYLLSRLEVDSSRSGIVRIVSSALARVDNTFSSVLDRFPWMTSPRDAWTLCAVAVRPAPGDLGTANSTPGLLSNSDEVGLNDCLMALGGSSTDHPVIYGFADPSAVPQVVVKVPLLDVEIADARAESRMLESLGHHAALSGLVPQLISTEQNPAFYAIAQSYVPGTPVSKVVSSSNIAEIAGKAIGAIGTIAEATRTASPQRHLADIVEAALHEAEGTVSPSLNVAMDETRAQLSNLKLDFMACQHRDLGPWNVHLDATGSIGFVDWSDASLKGLPVCDGVHFLTHLVLIADGGYQEVRRMDVLRSCVEPTHERAQLIDRCLTRYMNQLQLDAADIPRFRLLTWLLATINRPASERPGSLYEQLWQIQLEAN